MNYLQAHYCAAFAHSVPAYITYCYGIALNKQILYCRPKRTSGGAGRLTRCRLRFHLCAFSVDEALCFRLLSVGSLLWKIRYSSREGREYTPPEIQQKYNLHSHHAWSEAYSFHQRHCDSQSAAPLGCGFHVLRCSSSHGLLCVGLSFFFLLFNFTFWTSALFSPFSACIFTIFTV